MIFGYSYLTSMSTLIFHTYTSALIFKNQQIILVHTSSLTQAEKKWVDIAFLAPTLCANNLLEIEVDSEENSFYTLPNVDAYYKFARKL